MSWRRDFDAARDPYTARNALGILPTSGGGGAPTGAEYITSASDPTLTAERVLTNTATITWDFTTPGQAKASTAAGGGNVSNSGTPTAGQYGKWVTATTIQGVAPATVLSDIGAQPAGSYQPLDATLTALAAYNTNGLLTQTAAYTFTGRTLTGPATGITVSNGNGVAGNPTLALANDLAALEALAGTNTIYYRSAIDTWTAVTIGANLTFSGGTLAVTIPANYITSVSAPLSVTGSNLAIDLTAYLTTAAATAAYQPLDADLTAIAALTGTNTIYYRAAANTWSPVVVSTGLAFSGGNLTATGGGGNVSNVGTPVAGQIAQWTSATTIQGIAALFGPPQGRLSLQTTPVMTTTQAAKTVIYYTPYVGDRVPIYNGTTWAMTQLESSGSYISISTTDTTRNPSVIGASKINDWFVWDGGAGSLYLSHGPDWTNDTTRSAGTALVMVNGILLNNATIGNGTTTGPAASRGTYVGTTRSNASSQLDWIYGTSGAPPTAGFFGVWNCYNRVIVANQFGETTDSWTYAVAAWQAARNQATNRVSYVCGLAEDAIDARYNSVAAGTTGTINSTTGVGVDSTTAFSGSTAVASLTNDLGARVATYSGIPGVGFHFVAPLEYAVGGTATFFGDLGSVWLQSTFAIVLRM